MKRIALIATLVAVVPFAFGQSRVWQNNDQATNSYGPAGPTAAFMGQPGASEWTRWPERGSGINLGSPQVLTEMTVYYLANNGGNPMTGNENLTVQIYANDGGNLTGSNGNTFQAPNTLLYTSTPMKVLPGDRTAKFSIPSVACPANITFTLKFQGGIFDEGPYDPALNLNIPGGRFWGGPTAGLGVQGPTGVAYRRVFTVSGPSTFIAQERPATFPVVPFCFAATIWSGNTALLTNHYAIGNNLYNTGGFVPLGDPTGLNSSGVAAGNWVTGNGDARKISSIDFGYYADTLFSTGTPTFNLRLMKADDVNPWGAGGSNPDEATTLWDSGPQAIPLGQGGGGSGALQNVTLPVPNVVVPAEGFFWVMSVTGLTGGEDDFAGPGLMWSPEKGDCTNVLFLKDVPGTPGWGGYVFGTGSGTFLFTTIANAGPISFTGTAPTTTETLAPTAEQFVRGQGIAGTLASWAADDNNPRNVRKFIVINQTEAFIRVNLDYTTTKTNPTAISFVSKARMLDGGVFRISMSLRNDANAFVEVLPETAIGLSFATFTGNATGTLTDYVQAAGAMRGQIAVRQAGPSTAILPRSSFETGNMVVTG